MPNQPLQATAKSAPRLSGTTFGRHGGHGSQTMKSGDLSRWGVGAWRTFALGAERDLLDRLPTTVGVYSIRFVRQQSRLRGKSDITYIGKATNRHGLRGHIRQYFHPGWRQVDQLGNEGQT